MDHSFLQAAELLDEVLTLAWRQIRSHVLETKKARFAAETVLCARPPQIEALEQGRRGWAQRGGFAPEHDDSNRARIPL